MPLRDYLLAALGGVPRESVRVEPRFQGNSIVTGQLNDPQIAEFLRSGGSVSATGEVVNEHSALKRGVAWRCQQIICGIMQSMPADVMLRISEKKRAPAVTAPFRSVLTEKPNRWQTPGEFKSLLQLNLLNRGNGYAYKVRSRDRITELWPLDPNRTRVIQNADKSLTYRWQNATGNSIDLAQRDVLHLRGLSLDGITGLSVLTYACEAMGLSMAAERAGGRAFKNGVFAVPALEHPGQLDEGAYERLKQSFEENYVGADNAGRPMILEEGMKWSESAGGFSARDLQFMELRAFQRTDIGMFYGVPPHLYGDTDKSTSWGSGIESQNIGFLQYTMLAWLTTWREALKRDCLAEPQDDPKLYVHFDLNGFLKADAATRSTYFQAALGGSGSRGWMTQNEVREKEDFEPSDDPEADQLPKERGVTATNKGPANAPGPAGN